MTSHPMYRDLIKYPPDGIIYNIPKMATTVKDSTLIIKLKKKIWIEYTKFIPPSISIVVGKNDLIHSTFGTMVKNKFSWVVDVEHVAAFSNFHTDKMKNKWYKKEIIKLLSSDYCKKIMPWSYACKKSIDSYCNSNKISKKMEVVYPAIQSRKKKRYRKTNVITLIYVSRYFFEKGGNQVLEAFKRLDKKYDIRLLVLSRAPSEIKEAYKDFKNIKFVDKDFFNTNSMDELFNNYYMKSDIMVFPSFMDTFGGSLLEAMSCGLPVVTTNIFAIPEIVQDNYNGFLVNTPLSLYNKKDYSIKWGQKTNRWKEFCNLTKTVNSIFVENIVEKISQLIENVSIMKKFGKNGWNEINSGKFSIKERNKKLKKIYEEAIGGKN